MLCKIMDNFNLATINARGLNNATKRISLYERIKDHSIDITLIQESYCVKEFAKKSNFHWKGTVLSLFLSHVPIAEKPRFEKI